MPLELDGRRDLPNADEAHPLDVSVVGLSENLKLRV